MSTDLTPITDDPAAPFVAVARDADGRALIGLDARALDGLADFLGALPLAHDLLADGYSDDAVHVVTALQSAVARLLHPGLYA